MTHVHVCKGAEHQRSKRFYLIRTDDSLIGGYENHNNQPCYYTVDSFVAVLCVFVLSVTTVYSTFV